MGFLKKNLIAIICVVSIILLALPMVNVVAKAEVDASPFGDYGSVDGSSQTTVSGFKMLESSFFAYILIIGPALLTAMNYIKQLDKYKGLLSIVVPVVCIITLICLLLGAKSFAPSATSDVISLKTEIHIQIGANLLFVSYVATAIAGAVIFHDFRFNKEGIDKLKNSTSDMIKNANIGEAISQRVSSVGQAINQMQVPNWQPNSAEDTTHGNEPAANNQPRVAQTRNTSSKSHLNLSRTDEILSLIERLSMMKDAGILTEEEFAEKKKQLLGEIV